VRLFGSDPSRGGVLLYYAGTQFRKGPRGQVPLIVKDLSRSHETTNRSHLRGYGVVCTLLLSALS
jgi:hypothetical protein